METPVSQTIVPRLKKASKPGRIRAFIQVNALLLALLCCSVISSAAPITISNTPPPEGIITQVYTAFCFTATGDLAGISWRIRPGEFLPPGLSINTATGCLSGTPTSTGTFPFHVQVINTATNADEKLFTIIINHIGIDLYLVLDKSGSMGAEITGGGGSRWNALRNGVSSFFSIYQPNLTNSGNATGDQLGVRMFSSSDAPPVNAPFNVNQFVPVTKITNLTSILDGDSPGGSTAMGPGLLSARTFLLPGGVDNGHKKAMLLFTDGEQNVPPDVVAVPGSNPTVSGTDLTNGDKIQIHTIGLGVPGPATQILYNIAHESNGISNIADNSPLTAPDLNLNSYLNNVSLRLLSGSTPQYVDVRRNRFRVIDSSDGRIFGAEETFAVSKNIETIFINVLSQVVNESQARIGNIEKDGQQLSLFDTSIIKRTSGNGWETFIISVSGIKKTIPAFTSDGNWKVRVYDRSQTTGPYILSFIVDDHSAEMIGKTTQTKELVVGDRLPLSVDFTKNGQPINGGNVIAIIGKNIGDIGDILARTNAKFTIDTSADADNPGTQKLEELLKDSAFARLLLDSNHVVNLTFNAAQKKYVGEFTHLDVSGVYQVVYQASVSDTALGQINRYAEESIFVRFPDVNLDSSAIRIDTTAQTGISTLTFRPIGINGKFIGPGWGSAIKLDGTNTKITNVADNGDGSYVLTIQGSLTENVTLSIGTAKIYTGNLADIGKSGGNGGEVIYKQWWFWVIILIILILIIYLSTRKKKNP